MLGQFEAVEEGASSLPANPEPSHPGVPPLQLPPDVWEAIRDSLSASGRLETMRLEDYLFPPVANPYTPATAGLASEWDSSRPLSSRYHYQLLQEYLHCAGLKEGKVSWHNLKHTAIKLRMEAGEDELSLHELLGNGCLRQTRGYLSNLEQGPIRPLWREDETGPTVRNRIQHPAGKPHSHGLYAWRLPVTNLEELKADPAKGLESEIEVMRIILSRVLDLFMEAMTAEKKLHLLEVYSRAIGKLANLLLAQQALEGKPDSHAEALQQAMREAYEKLTGEKPDP